MKLFYLSLYLISVSLLLVNCSDKSKLTPYEFTAIYMDSLELKVPDQDFTISEDLLITSKEDSIQHFLDNAYTEYLGNPGDIGNILSRYTSAASEIHKYDKETIKISNIVPVIKPIAYIDELKRLVKGKDLPIVFEPYNDKLIIVFAQDNNHSIAYLNPDDFQKLNIEKPKLLETAIDNLKRKLEGLVNKVGDDGLYGIAAGGDYEASLILFDNIWTKEFFPVDGKFVIAIPNRDLLLIAGSNDTEGVEKIRQLAKQYNAEGNYPICPDLFTWDGEKFK
ncbi:DUF1444 family protein [Dysgonomonas macrotermitis]|uniref:DUF1444 family protein n=1 Tax=Dysgonomonas macrotermitis TaxID=1346286 RepID=A0A1M5AKZ3_9BACT|nr:DUF1444 family protein [Dysgonomonas macrotermitis]SHF30835.1 Protein of unknown function [Dysgonomonas macrotermitis]